MANEKDIKTALENIAKDIYSESENIQDSEAVIGEKKMNQQEEIMEEEEDFDLFGISMD